MTQLEGRYDLQRDDDLDRRGWVEPVLDQHRLATNWQAIALSSRVERSRRVWMLVAAGGWATAALVALLVMAYRPFGGSKPPTVNTLDKGMVLNTGSQRQRRTLADGSQLVAGPHSRVALHELSDRRVQLVLERGEVLFDVASKPSRTFVVKLGRASVTVVGTRFRVARRRQENDGTVTFALSVEVERGLVQVRHAQHTTELGPGERWQVSEGAAAIDSEITRTQVIDAALPPIEVQRDQATKTNTASRRRRLQRQHQRLRRPHQTSEPRRQGREVGSRQSSDVPTTTDSTEAFRAASMARRSGRYKDAIRGYRDFVTRFTGDARSGLAWLELGRLLMDHARDLRGAAAALERALTHNIGTLREDAFARLVLCYHRLGQGGRCQAARSRYLEAFPAGRYHAHLQDRCTSQR